MINNEYFEDNDEKKYEGINLKDFYQNNSSDTSTKQSPEKLEIIDFMEFSELNIDDSVLECLRNPEYKKPFKFESYYGNYSLEFEKLLYIEDPQCEYLIFKPLNYVFEENDFLIGKKFLVYQINIDDMCLYLLDDSEFIESLYYEEYYSEISELLITEFRNSGLEVLDMSEFLEFDIDENILKNIKDKSFTDTFILKTKDEQYTVKFEKIAYIGGEFAEYVILRALNHIFLENGDFSIVENMLVYEINSENMVLNLIVYDDIISDLLENYYYNPTDENDDESIEENDYSDELTNDTQNNSSIPFDETEDAYEKLFTENYNDYIILKTIHNEKMMLKRIGTLVYRKKEYLIVKIIKKENSDKENFYLIYRIDYENDNKKLTTIYKKGFTKKILKIYSKKNNINLS